MVRQTQDKLLRLKVERGGGEGAEGGGGWRGETHGGGGAEGVEGKAAAGVGLLLCSREGT